MQSAWVAAKHLIISPSGRVPTSLRSDLKWGLQIATDEAMKTGRQRKARLISPDVRTNIHVTRPSRDTPTQTPAHRDASGRCAPLLYRACCSPQAPVPPPCRSKALGALGCLGGLLHQAS